MSYSYIGGHYDIAKYENTPTQFREKFVYQEILKALCSEVQSLEDTMQLMYSQRGINTSTGIQLDNIGEWLGVKRAGGQSDTDYRDLLYAAIGKRRADGTGDKVLRTMMGLYHSQVGQIFEHNSAMTGGVVVRVNDTRNAAKSFVNILSSITPTCIGSVAVLRDTTQQGVAWTPVELAGNSAALVDQDLSQFETDGHLGLVADISESGLEQSMLGTFADAGISSGYLLVEQGADSGANTLALESGGRLLVEHESAAGGIYGFFAEVSQIRMGQTNVEGEV